MRSRELPKAPVLANSTVLARALAGAAAVASALALAGCGSASVHPAAAPDPARSGGARCTTADVRITLAAGAAGAAAGSSFVPIEFTNRTRAACGLAGYPAVSFASADGAAIGAVAARDATMHARAVVLPAGGTAHAWLQILDAANYPAGRCRPVTAHGLRVALPGLAGASFLGHAFLACTAAGAPGGLLTVQPIEAGPARRGTA
jgi:hypothetical protein